MAEAEKQLELKFRIFDGTDIGHGTYSQSITAATLKHRLLSQWPRGCPSVSAHPHTEIFLLYKHDCY